MTIYNADFQEVDPYAPIGICDICGADAWTTSIHGLFCPSHENILDEYALDEYKPLPLVDELVDALEDAGFAVSVSYPYVIVSLRNRPLAPHEVAWALDIDPALCVRNLAGNIRIRAD